MRFLKQFLGVRVAVCSIVWMVAQPGLAQVPLGLDEALRVAVGRSPQIAAQDALADAAQEQAVVAGQLPDPVLKLGIDNLPTNGADRFNLTGESTTLRVGVMQELPRAHKRQLRAQRFGQDAQRALAERQVAYARVQRDTTLAWLDRYYAQAVREVLVRQEEETRLQVDAAVVLYAAGRGSQADVFAARAAQVVLQDRLSQSDRQARGAQLLLARWVGDAAAQRPLAGVPSRPRAPWQGAVAREDLLRHPDLLVMAAQTATAHTEHQLAVAEREADWSVELSYSQRNAANANMLSLGVNVPLQWNGAQRQDRVVRSKQALLREAEARLEDTLRSHEADVRKLENDWANAQERQTRVSDQLLPLAEQRVHAALSSYRAGKGDLPSVLAARRDVIDVQLQALGLAQETARLAAQLDYLTPVFHPTTDLDTDRNAYTTPSPHPEQQP